MFNTNVIMGQTSVDQKYLTWCFKNILREKHNTMVFFL